MTPMIDVSTQTDLDATPVETSGGSSPSEAPSTHTFLQLTDAAPTNIPGGRPLSDATTRIETPTTHTFLPLTAPILTWTAPTTNTFLPLTAPIITSPPPAVSANTERKAHEETLQELAETQAQITAKDEELERCRALVAEATESSAVHPQQYNEAQTQTDEAYIYIADLRASESRLQEQVDSSQDEVNNLRAALQEATSRVSELEVERTNSEESIKLKDREIQKLKGDAARMSEHIRVGFQELREFLTLSVLMYNRLVQAQDILNVTLGPDDWLMGSASWNLERWNALVAAYFGDVTSAEAEVSTEAEVVSGRELAIVRRPADSSAVNQAETGPVYEVSADDDQLKQLIDEILEAADANGGASKVETEGLAAEEEVEEPKAESRKTSKTASIFAAGAGIDLPSSSPSSAAKGKQKEERTGAIGQEGSNTFSFAPSEDGVRAEQTPRSHGFEGASPNFSFTSTSTFDFAASAKQAEEPTPFFGAEGSRQFTFSPTSLAPTFGGSSGSSVDDSNIGSGSIYTQTAKNEDQEPDRNSSKVASETPKFSFTGGFDFSVSSSQGLQEEEQAPKTAIFGGESSHSFSFTPSSFTPTSSSVGSSPSDDDGEEDKPKRESTKKAPNQPLFSAEAFARFDSGPSNKKFNFSDINFPIMGASEVQVESSPSSLNPGTTDALQDEDDAHLYELEEGYQPPPERQIGVGQARVEPASTADTNGGEDVGGDSTGVPRITITPPSTFEDNVEVGSAPQRRIGVDQAEVEPASTADTNGGEDADGDSTEVPRITIAPADNVEVASSNILEQNGFDVSSLSRIVASGSPVAQEDVERRNLEAENHGTESLCERLLPREGHYPSFAEATGIQDVVWHGRGRTAKEILSECEKGFGTKDGVEDDIASVISGFGSLRLRPSRRSAGSGTRMENTRVDGDDRAAERGAPKDDEPGTKVVKEDGCATRAAEAQPDTAVDSQPNELSSATVVDGTMQPPMGSQVESTAPSSSSSSSSLSSSSYSSPPKAPPVSTPPTTHTPPEPERRSRNGNPMNENGQLYIWNVWPRTRQKKPLL